MLEDTATPLACRHDQGFAAALAACGATLLASTARDGWLLAVRAADDGIDVQASRHDVPMGIAVRPGALAAVTGTRVTLFREQTMPDLDGHGSVSCWLPHTEHHVGDLRAHELAWGEDGLWMVATRFNQLARVVEGYSFEPGWSPGFATQPREEDACHLNGLAMAQGRPAYATALAPRGDAGGWRQAGPHGGVLLSVASGETVLDGLCLPHSPRWHMDRLWLLESGTGRLGLVDRQARRLETVARLPAFVRGLALSGGTAFVGCSAIRDGAGFGALPLHDDPGRSAIRRGVAAVHLHSGGVLGWLEIETGAEEVFDLQLLAGSPRAAVLSAADPLALNAFAVPPHAAGGLAADG